MKRIVSSFLGGMMTLAVAYGQTPTSLQDAYRGTFRIGAALDPAKFEEHDQRGNPVIAAHFNTISPENALKWQSLRLRQDGYDFRQADKFIGHTLVWHNAYSANRPSRAVLSMGERLACRPLCAPH